MPHINIKIAGPTLAFEQICRLQRHATELVAALSGEPPESISVLVEQTTVRGWSLQGQATQLAAHVHARMRETTPDQKARYIAGLHALLRSVLGAELPEATCVILDELPDCAEDFGGMTQTRSRKTPFRSVAAECRHLQHQET